MVDDGSLVGGGYLPLWKMMEWKSVGMMTFPMYGNIKFMFEITNQLEVSLWFSYPILRKLRLREVEIPLGKSVGAAIDPHNSKNVKKRMPDQTILKELFIEVSGFTACKLTHTWNGPWKQTALKATNWQRMRKYMGSRAEKQTYRNHFSDQRMLKVLINLFPIGSMVLVYMVTWIPSIYPKCKHINQHHGSYGFLFLINVWKPCSQILLCIGANVGLWAGVLGRALGSGLLTRGTAQTVLCEPIVFHAWHRSLSMSICQSGFNDYNASVWNRAQVSRSRSRMELK